MSKAEKFIQDCTRNCNNEVGGWIDGEYSPFYQLWLTPDDARKAVEIAKEETLDMVCKYVKDNLYKHLYVCNGEAGFPTFQFINDLKQAIKDETQNL